MLLPLAALGSSDGMASERLAPRCVRVGRGSDNSVLSDLRQPQTNDDTSFSCEDSTRPKYPSGLLAQTLYLQREATNDDALTANGELTSRPDLSGFARGWAAEALLLEHTLGKSREEHCKPP